ncbi:helix-turn-helix domain-containing protein, partial [Staphylococcus aureus]
MTTIAGIIDSVQAARIAGCHPNTVNRWCQSGDLRSVKVGKK